MRRAKEEPATLARGLACAGVTEEATEERLCLPAAKGPAIGGLQQRVDHLVLGPRGTARRKVGRPLRAELLGHPKTAS